jgi:PAS domain S-box-containing protein
MATPSGPEAAELERKVQERTSGLAQANQSLVDEVATRKQIEEQLRQSETRFRDLADSMPQIVWVVGPDDKLEYINRRWTEYTGLSVEESRDQGKIDAVIHPDDVARLHAESAKANRSLTPYQFEFRLRRAADGVYRWFLGRGVPVLDEQGQVVRWYGTSTDIHDQKQAQEELRESARRKDHFLATLAHELRGPLPPIRNALEIMRLEGNNPSRLERSRSMMERQIKQLVRLIDDLIDVSRMSRGKIHLQKEHVELAQVVGSAVETIEPLLREAGHELTVHLPAEPISLEADPARLIQVLVNLLGNAARYTDPGGRIMLTAESDEDRLVVAIHDTGIGMSAEQLGQLFEMFTQVGRSDERSQGGLGVGLWLVRRLLELHGGTVEAQSEGPDQGSTFTICLPLGEAG